MRQMNDKLKFTFRAWPVIAAATIGLCFLTQGVAKLFGIDLPDQHQIEEVRYMFAHAFDSAEAFAMMCAGVFQVLILMPVVEEFLFRWLMVMLPTRIGEGRRETADAGRVLGNFQLLLFLVSSALFSTAHYIDYVSLIHGRGFAMTGWNAAFLALFFFGLAQCWLYRKTNRIWCPMLNHALFNLTNLVLLFVVPA